MSKTLGLSDLPGTATAPEDGASSNGNQRARTQLARREFLRLATAAALGTGLAFAGLANLVLPKPPLLVAIALIGTTTAVVLATDVGQAGCRLPENRRQVRQRVLRMEPSVGALMFGFELGTGVRTFLTGKAPYIILVAAVLATTHGPVAAMLVGLGFGLGRGLVPLDRAMSYEVDAWDSCSRQHGQHAIPVLAALLTGGVAVAAVVM